MLFFAGSASAQATRLDELRRQAQECEKSGDWLGACRLYDEMIRKDRGNVEARESYHRCYRQYQITRRHSDHVYRDALARLKPTEALDVYEAVLKKIAETYVDPSKTEVTALFRHGVQELRYALSQDVFVSEYMKGARPAAVAAFKLHLDNWPEHKIASRSEVRDLILSLAATAQQVGLVQNKTSFAVVLALEFAYGACTGLDEYTLFLTPERYTAVSATLRGKFVGVGIDLNSALEITRIYPGSAAAETSMVYPVPLHEHDRITRIDQQAVQDMRVEDAAEKLRGAPESVVEIEVFTPGDNTTLRRYVLTRRAVVIPSVEFRMEEDGEYAGIGYIKINHFQDTTLKDVQEALAVLHSRDMKGLVLDLSGNPGGSFLSAVKIAELFLPEGVIVNTSSQFPDLDKPYRVKGMGTADATPLCVVIDSETASSAELLAGALKENGRAIKLIGQTTFGKGSIQCIIPLKPSPGGIRITVAKFTSPDKKPYNYVGISPDTDCNIDVGSLAIVQAKKELKQDRLKRLSPPMMMMQPPGSM